MTTIGVREAFGPPPDEEKIQSYVAQNSPTQLWREIAAANFDPTDVLAFADILSMFIKADDHAIALYSGTLGELERYPERASPDTNLMGAWVSLFMTCSRRGRTEEAVKAYYKAAHLGYDDAKSKVLLATHLHALGRYSDSLDVLSTVLDSHTLGSGPNQIPAGMYDIAVRLKNELMAKTNRSRPPASLARLAWYFNDDLQPIPDAIPNLAFAELEPKGVTQEVLESLRSAFICQVSPDRKVWYVSFYDRADPIELIEENDFGRFMIWYYIDPTSNRLRGFDVHFS